METSVQKDKQTMVRRATPSGKVETPTDTTDTNDTDVVDTGDTETMTLVKRSLIPLQTSKI